MKNVRKIVFFPNWNNTNVLVQNNCFIFGFCTKLIFKKRMESLTKGRHNFSDQHATFIIIYSVTKIKIVFNYKTTWKLHFSGYINNIFQTRIISNGRIPFPHEKQTRTNGHFEELFLRILGRSRRSIPGQSFLSGQDPHAVQLSCCNRCRTPVQL